MTRTKKRIEAMRLFAILFTILSLFTSEALSQPVMELIEKNPAYASCNYSIYPDSIPDNLTPAPFGKRPFYISSSLWQASVLYLPLWTTWFPIHQQP